MEFQYFWPPKNSAVIILESAVANKKLERMAIEVAERNLASEELVLVGIAEHGVAIANRIAGLLKKYFSGKIVHARLELDKTNASNVVLHHEGSLQGRQVILVDDVANSGRVMMHGICAILHQKPACIETLALVERQHKLYPLQVTYVGLTVSTSPNQFINVAVEGQDITARLVS